MNTPIRLALVAATVVGCRDGGPGTTDSSDGSSTATTPTDTEASFIPVAFGVKEARFRLQDDGRIGPTDDGTWSITVELIAENDDWCDAVFSGTTDAPQPVFPGVENVFGRAMRPEGPPSGSCADADLPVPWADPMPVLDAWDFAVGITGSPSQDVLDSMDPNDVEVLEPYLFGGGVYLEGVDGDGDGNADQQPWRDVAIAWCEDDTGNLVRTTDQISGGALLPGTYVVQAQQVFTPARALLLPPQ